MTSDTEMIRRSPSEIRQLVREGRWGRKHLLVVQREFGDELLFDALYGVFTENSPSFHDQQVAAAFLLELHPACHLPLQQALRATLANWNLSIEELPLYFSRMYGREAVLAVLSAIETEAGLSPQETRSIETYRYWLKSDEKRVFPA